MGFGRGGAPDPAIRPGAGQQHRVKTAAPTASAFAPDHGASSPRPSQPAVGIGANFSRRPRRRFASPSGGFWSGRRTRCCDSATCRPAASLGYGGPDRLSLRARPWRMRATAEPTGRRDRCEFFAPAPTPICVATAALSLPATAADGDVLGPYSLAPYLIGQVQRSIGITRLACPPSSGSPPVVVRGHDWLTPIQPTHPGGWCVNGIDEWNGAPICSSTS